MKVFSKVCYRYLFMFLIPSFLIPGCSSDKKFKFTFSRKDGESYIQKLSVSRERHMSPTNIQMDDTLSETRVTCEKTGDGWNIKSRPVNRIMYRNGKEVKNSLLSLLSEFVITYRVNENGELKDIEGYERVKEAIDSKFPPDVAEGLTSTLDIEALKQRESTEWNRRIGDFINREFSIGDVWESETSVILPNGVELTYRVKTSFKELVQHKNIECVVIEQTYNSAGEGMANLVNNVAESASMEGDNKKDASIKGGKVSSSIKGKVTRLIDPSTMNIYQEEAERTILMEMDVQGVGQIPVKMIETRSYDYEYGP